MILRGINRGVVEGASGLNAFFCEGYLYHWLLSLCPGFTFDGVGFVAKTTTLLERVGNMPLRADGITPVELLKPKCIYVDLAKGLAMNAVGLSGPGAQFLLEKGIWQKRTDAFSLSFMSVAPTAEERLKEFQEFVTLLKGHLKFFFAQGKKVALQINLSCPNVKVHIGHIVDEAHKMADIGAVLGIPLIFKINLLVSIDEARAITRHKHCDAICLTNTLPYGSQPHDEKNKIDWQDLLSMNESPLKQFGGGGLSGAPLFPLLIDWLRRADGNIHKPMIVGGGVLGPECVRRIREVARPETIALGSIAMLRPWNLAATIREAKRIIR